MDVSPAVITAAQAGDQAAYGALYRCYQPQITSYVHSLAWRWASSLDQEDVVSTVFLHLVQRFASYHPQVGKPFSAWLFRLAHNAAVDAFRIRRPVIALELIPGIPNQQAPLAFTSVELRGELQQALTSLSLREREAFLLHHHYGYSLKEIAPRLGTSPERIKAALWRARQRLQHTLQKGVRPVQDF